MDELCKKHRKLHICLSLFLTLALMLTMGLFPSQQTFAAAGKKAAPPRVTLLLGGDLMCQYRQQEAAYNGKGYSFHYAFDYMRELIGGADFAVANLETNISPSSPLGRHQKKKYGKPYLNAPVSYLSALKKAGFDVLVGANNHNADTGVKGLKETISNVDKKGFKRTGIFKDSKERRFVILKKNGIKVGVASYATYFNVSIKDFNSAQKDTYLNEYSKSRVRRDIKNMKKQGAEFIIIYFHSGKEYTSEPSSKQLRIAKEIADAGADYILCSHSHTVQPYGTITAKSGKKVPVAYGLGNFISHMTHKRNTTYGMMISLTLTKTKGRVKVRKEGYYPLRVLTENQETGKKYQLLPATKETIGKVRNKTVVRKLKTARREIAKTVGKGIEQY